MRTITRSRMCKECEECPYKSNCNNKRMVAEMAMVPNEVQNATQNLNTPCLSATASIKINNNMSDSLLIEKQIMRNINRNFCSIESRW